MTATKEQEFVISRTFDAPRDLVWKAFSEAEALAQWWGPKGFVTEVIKLDFRPGGIFHYSMRSAGGTEMWGRFDYKEIDEPERVVFVNSFSNAAGERTRSPFHDTWPLEVLNNMTFTEEDGKTTLTLVGGPINATAEECQTFANNHKSMQGGFSGTFEQLEAYLRGAK